MGNCATIKSPANIQASAQSLKTSYEQMIQQIKASRTLLIKQFVRNQEDQKDMEEDFSFLQDLKLVKSHCKGIELKYQFNTTIHTLQEIETKFQLLENLQKIELDKKVTVGKKELNQKTKRIIDEVSHLRLVIYDYFYSDLEVTDVPNELI